MCLVVEDAWRGGCWELEEVSWGGGTMNRKLCFTEGLVEPPGQATAASSPLS